MALLYTPSAKCATETEFALMANAKREFEQEKLPVPLDEVFAFGFSQVFPSDSSDFFLLFLFCSALRSLGSGTREIICVWIHLVGFKIVSYSCGFARAKEEEERHTLTNPLVIKMHAPKPFYDARATKDCER